MQINPTHSPALRSEVLTKAFIRATTLLALKATEIGKIAGMSPASWSRVSNYKRAIQVDTKEAEFALLTIRIFRSLDALFGGNAQRSREWLRAQNHHLNGIPAELIQTTEGLVRVTTYLDAMRGLA